MPFSSFHPFRTFYRLQGPTPLWSFPTSLSYALGRRAAGRQSLVPFNPVVYSKQKMALQRRMKLDLALSGAATTQDQDKASPTTLEELRWRG